MPYQATVIPIMIASPGDIFEEREVARDVIHKWNYAHSIRTKVILAPAGWETHSSPELGIRPQELINTRILKDCDLLIGIFWTRLGTPTGKSESGTVEEIEEHISVGKPAMIYFSSKPAAPESFNQEQFGALKAFKERCREWGLVEEFDNIIDFRDKFSHQLQLCLYQNPYLQNIIKGELASAEESESASVGLITSQLKISEEAQILLKIASEKDDGTILKVDFMGGRLIQVGGQSFGGKIGRDSSRWESALNELLKQELIVARGHKGEIFELTNKGWTLADELKKQSDS